MQTPVNFKTSFGIFVGALSYDSEEYLRWIKKEAERFINAKLGFTSYVDEVIWFNGEADRSTDSEEKARLKDLAIAVQMFANGKKHEDAPWISYEGYYLKWGFALNTVTKERRDREKDREQSVNIRGLYSDLYAKAKISAMHNSKTIGTWLNEAIELKLAEEDKAAVQKDRPEK